MSRKLVELLKTQDDTATNNTLFRAIKRGTPKYEKHPNYLRVFIEKRKKEVASCNIFRIDEIVLYLITDFKFIPLWLIQQWYSDFNQTSIYSILEGWMSVGLVWLETDPTGVFIRPTKHLLKLFGEEKVSYVPIPKQFLNHSFGEAQVVFDMMIGNSKSELWQLIKDNELVPPYKPLGLDYTQGISGSLIVRENWIRIGYSNREWLWNMDKEIEKEITQKKKFTKEFSDLKLFQLIYKEGDNWVSQIPDLVIPIPREDGQPRSYAIEVELTSKGPDRYEKILNNYKNNIKFGKLFYLAGDVKVAKDIMTAYKKIGEDLGSCKLYLMPFKTPAMKMSNYSFEDEETTKRVFKLNLR